MNFLEVFKIIAQLLPLIIQAIKAIEEAIPGAGAGEQKLAAVREILESVTEFAGGEAISQIWPTLQKVISSLVALFNKTGVFGK